MESTPKRMLVAVRLTFRQMRKRFGVQAGATLAALCAAWYAALSLALFSRFGGEPVGALALRGLFWISWLGAGPVALTLAGDLGARDRDEGIVELAQARGLGEELLAVGRLQAAWLCLVRVMAPPVLLLAGLSVALSGTLQLLGARVLLALGMLVYVAVLALALAALARLAAAALPRNGVWLLVGVIVGPELMPAALLGDVPTVPRVFSLFISQLAVVGGAAG